MSYQIRDALPTDVPGILDIYNDAVRNTTAIWNETPVDLGNRGEITGNIRPSDGIARAVIYYPVR